MDDRRLANVVKGNTNISYAYNVDLEAGVYSSEAVYENGSTASFAKFGNAKVDVSANCSKKGIGATISGYVSAYTMDGTLAFNIGKIKIKIYGAVHIGYLGGGYSFGTKNGFDTPGVGVGASFSIDFEEVE